VLGPPEGQPDTKTKIDNARHERPQILDRRTATSP
jgi:hypothetical protein